MGPVCPKCEGKVFTSTSRSFQGNMTLIIYSHACGAVLGVVNKTH